MGISEDRADKFVVVVICTSGTVHRKGKGKGKFAPVEAYWGSGGVAPFIL
jgi:rhodanese-related sulfurtransferase